MTIFQEFVAACLADDTDAIISAGFTSGVFAGLCLRDCARDDYSIFKPDIEQQLRGIHGIRKLCLVGSVVNGITNCVLQLTSMPSLNAVTALSNVDRLEAGLCFASGVLAAELKNDETTEAVSITDQFILAAQIFEAQRNLLKLRDRFLNKNNVPPEALRQISKTRKPVYLNEGIEDWFTQLCRARDQRN